MQVQSPRWDDLLEEGMATHSAHEDRGLWWAAAYGAVERRAHLRRLSRHTLTFYEGNCYLLTSRFYPQTISGFSIAADDILIKRVDNFQSVKK